MRVLVTGGAGYIGSHTVAALIDKGYDVIVADNLVKGHRDAVKEVTLMVGDLRDGKFLDSVFEKGIDAVVHFAAYSIVGESMQDPLKYYDNNVGGAISLLEAMERHGVKKIVFSSTAAVYGEPDRVPILETDAKRPTNVYGRTKLVIEGMLEDCRQAWGLNYCALRYFNAAGARYDLDIGEDHRPETHLIPIVLDAARGRREKMSIFGDDYPTRDGSCVRDYIHVCDLADAHVLALEYLAAGGKSDAFNLGSGSGFSNFEILDRCKAVTGKEIKTEITERRPGDPATLIASSKKAREVLSWDPKFTSVDDILYSAWRWHSEHPDGFDD